MKKGKHLLVIRLSAMGDVAMTVPVLLALIQQYPEVKITVLTKPFFKPIFSDIPQVTVYNAQVKGKHRGFFGLRKLYKELKTLQIDEVADLHHVLRSNILQLFFKFGGYKTAQINKGRSEKKALISGSHKELKPLKTTHERYAEVFQKLGHVLSLDDVSLLTKATVIRDFPLHHDTASKKRIGIAPFAAFHGKTYPSHLMEEVIALLNAKNDYKILLFGGGKIERDHISKWEEKYDHVFAVIGKYSFKEELDIISNLDLMVSMDSGNGHLAANYGIPVVSIWGVTHPSAGFAPFKQVAENQLLADRSEFPLIPTSIYGNKMPTGYEKAIETIRPETIVNRIVGILDCLI